VYHPRDGASVYDIQIDAAEISEDDAYPGRLIIFPDKDLLFAADFRRSGADLLLAGPNAEAAIIYGYFKDERRPSLVTPEGASLTGAVIEALAGPDRPGEYAQAAVAATTTQVSIGRVEKVSGSATVLRNGVPVELHLGDPVAKGDVVQTSSDSSLTIKFSDGMVFGLSSSARIVLNEMVYAADAPGGSALITLVQGVIGFVAGRIAKTGDLKVETPVATMAIRGTAVQTEISAASGTTKFSLLTEPNGVVGSFLLLDKTNLSRVLTTISDSSVAMIVTPVTSSEVRITQVSKTANDIRIEGDFVRALFQIFAPERQRRGSSDDDGIPVVPVNTHLPSDGLGQTDFSITPVIPQLPGPRASAPGEPRSTTLQGSATEDGPFARLDAIADSSIQTPGLGTPTVIVPSSLPPGVAYQQSTRTFSLDPSHPAYQRLAEGEKAVVTVNYSLSFSGAQAPASASWTVTGRNDAPVARDDRIVEVDETGRSVLATRANDSDVDRDLLHIVDWTQPLEGSITLNSSGQMIFDPGEDFRALSEGETATVSFSYTVSDHKGGIDAATATVQVQGSGTFSAPHVTAETSGVLAFNNQPVSLKIDAPSRTTTTTADLALTFGLGSAVQTQMNIMFAIDVSGSTTTEFAGTPVGDLNQDGVANTILDAEIGSLARLTEQMRTLGFSPADVTVTVIPFNGSANPADAENPAQNDDNTASVTFTLGDTGDQTIANFLGSLKAGGGTNFEDALQATIERLQALDQGGEKNLIYFLSDGNGTGTFADELATLEAAHQAQITAVGIGENANLSLLDQIDNTGSAELATSTDQLDASLLGAPLPSGQVIDLDVVVNGIEVPGIKFDDIASTPGRHTLEIPLAGLARQAGDTNTVSASITFASGETLNTQLNIAGALPLSTDFIL
jgi:hypothetical protein